MPSLEDLEVLAWKSSAPILLTIVGQKILVTEVHRVKNHIVAPCCPVPWQYRRIDKNQPWGEGNLAPYTYFARKRPYAQFCPLPQQYRQPRLDQPSNFSLAKYFAHKRHPDKPWLRTIPAWFIRGTCHSLAEAWQRYKSGKGGKPRFKSCRDATDTLIHEDPKSFTVTAVGGHDRDGLIRIPRLGVFRVKHLWQEWGDRPIKVLKIAKRPDGWYLQLTGAFDEQPLKERAIACTIAAPKGISPLLGTTDTGKEIRAYAPDPRLLARKAKLQQQLARQTLGGSNWQKTQRKLARLEKRLADQAKAHNQKLSTFLIRTYGKLILEGVGQRRVLRKPTARRRAKTLAPIHFDPNGAAAIAAYNQHVASQRSGQFVALIKQKGKVGGRDVVAVTAK
ncbi:MAG: hypothetical protein O3A14_11400 [Cyanobacteria bacterium]|nr:hypothetical protein [Cyanobacteriota bacterium]